MEWINGIQGALQYIESHLDEELDYEALAKVSLSSNHHFQRVFSILTGYPLGEYIRNRRLSQAGAELAAGEGRVIDIAVKYGYDSPDSFSKAFYRFHGILPSQAKEPGAKLRSFSPLSIKLTLEGGSMLQYKLVEKPALTLVGFRRRFHGTPADKENQEHYFAEDTRLKQMILGGASGDTETTYMVMTNFDDGGYDCYLASYLDPDQSKTFDEDVGAEVSGWFQRIEIPAGLYLVCETEHCQWPMELVEPLRAKVVSEWLPSSDYEMDARPEVNVIHWPYRYQDEERKNNHSVELWIPLTKQI
jgi:AraC family transcriptional regulator